MKLYLAADSGGSKTVWQLIDNKGKTVFSCRTQGLGAVSEGVLPVRETVREAAEQLHGTPAAIHLSLGGPNTQEVQTALEEAWPGVPVKVEREACGDSVLLAAEFFGCTAAVMCGTGSTAVGVKNGKRTYCGGWGPIYGDGGSGGGLGREALKLFLRSLDGQENLGKTAKLFENLTKNLDISDFYGRMEAKKRALSLPRQALAALAPDLYALWEQGDETACRLFENEAREVASMAQAVSDEDGSILLCGGFFAEKPKFLAACREKTKRKLVYKQDFAPIIGVELSLLKENGIQLTDELFERILEANRR